MKKNNKETNKGGWHSKGALIPTALSCPCCGAPNPFAYAQLFCKTCYPTICKIVRERMEKDKVDEVFKKAHN